MKRFTNNGKGGAAARLIALMLIAVMAVGAIAKCPGLFLGGTLEADDFHVYSTEVEAGVWGVEIDGMGEGELDVYVYNENGHLLAADTEEGNQAFVLFEVDYDQTIYIFVHNAGEGKSEYIGFLD